MLGTGDIYGDLLKVAAGFGGGLSRAAKRVLEQMRQDPNIRIVLSNVAVLTRITTDSGTPWVEATAADQHWYRVEQTSPSVTFQLLDAGLVKMEADTPGYKVYALAQPKKATATGKQADKEFDRKLDMWGHGGEECAECGKQDYEQNMVEHDGKMYCTDCAGELGIGDEEADYQQVVDHLKTDAGITDAEVEATGGNIDVIKVPCGKYVLYFGTAGDMWGASVYKKVNHPFPDDEEITNINDVWTNVSSYETDPTAVALGITQAAMKFDQQYCGGKHKGKQGAVKTAAAKYTKGEGVKSNTGYTGKVTDAQQDAAGNWVYTVDYKQLGPRKNQPEASLARTSTKTKAPYTPATGKDLADYLQKVGYRLWVMVRKPQNLAKVRAQYEDATGGDPLPSSAIVEQYGGKGNFDEEWFIVAPYSEDMPSDVEIVESGSGSGPGKQPYPVGIRQGNKVEFHYWETVKEMLQSGLRANKPSSI